MTMINTEKFTIIKVRSVGLSKHTLGCMCFSFDEHCLLTIVTKDRAELANVCFNINKNREPFSPHGECKAWC